MKPTPRLLHPEVRATIAVILEDARRRFHESPRMSRRIERALLALKLATVEHQIATVRHPTDTGDASSPRRMTP